MKSLITIYEGILDNVDSAIDNMDNTIKDMKTLHWGFAYLNNLPSITAKNVKGGLTAFGKKYFKNIPVIFTDIYKTAPNINKDPDKVYPYKKIDAAGEYLAAYILSTPLEKPLDQYDFTNKSDMCDIKLAIINHLNKISTNTAYLDTYISIMYNPRSGPGTLEFKLYSTKDEDFKLQHRADRAAKFGFDESNLIVRLNFTKGQFYPIR